MYRLLRLGLLRLGLFCLAAGVGGFARRGCAADGAVDFGTEKVKDVSDAVDGAVGESSGFEIFFDCHDYCHENVG